VGCEKDDCEVAAVAGVGDKFSERSGVRLVVFVLVVDEDVWWFGGGVADMPLPTGLRGICVSSEVSEERSLSWLELCAYWVECEGCFSVEDMSCSSSWSTRGCNLVPRSGNVRPLF
jgi:hypothetical protein